MEVVITDANINEVLSSPLPVMIDFWAAWCGPCRMLSPTVDDMAQAYDGRVVVARCNVDDCPDISMQFGIRSIPTLIFFKGGQIVEKTVGVVSGKEIEAILDRLI